MVEFVGQTEESILLSPYPGRQTAPYSHPTAQVVLTVDDPAALDPDGTLAAPGFQDVGMKSVFPPVEHAGVIDDKATLAEEWFEQFHVLPRRIDLGNLLTTQLVDVEVYNALRHTTGDWTAWIDNVGPGVDLLSIPSLPAVVPPQFGYQLQLEVTTDAPPVVDTTLDYYFSTGVILIPITFRVVLLLPAVPESPYDEILEFLTDVLPKRTGAEQRISLRRTPRQIFEGLQFVLEDGPERMRLDNLLFDWQDRAFGFPLWHEATRTTAAISVGATTIPVQSTADADYRVGGLIAIYADQVLNDVLTVDSFDATSIDVETPTLNAYGARTRVAPLRVCVIQGSVGGGRWRVNAGRYEMSLRVIEEGVDLSDLGGYSTYKGSPLLDDCNIVQGFLSEEHSIEVVVIDGGVGLTDQASDRSRNRRSSQKVFLARNRAELWNIRQLLHFLHGPQVSFYLPTFGEDLTPIAALASASSVLSVRNAGYTDLIRRRIPRLDIWVRLKDGTKLLREITDATIIDADEEQLTVDSPWPSTIAVADIDRISYLEKTRFDDDRIRIEHRSSGVSRVGGPTLSVIE